MIDDDKVTRWAQEKVSALLVRAAMAAVAALNQQSYEAAAAAERIRRWALG